MKPAVYAIAWSSKGPSKVGVTGNLIVRLNELQTAHPYRLRIYFAALVLSGDSAFEIERVVLADNSAKRLVGEWVSVPPQALARCIRRVCEERRIVWEPWKPTEVQLERRRAKLEGRDSQFEKRAADAYAEARRLLG